MITRLTKFCYYLFYEMVGLTTMLRGPSFRAAAPHSLAALLSLLRLSLALGIHRALIKAPSVLRDLHRNPCM